MQPKVYLAGPIDGVNDAEAQYWRYAALGFLSSKCLVSNPMDRDFRGREEGNEAPIVEGDKLAIDTCNVLLANAWKITPGTMMEILYAWEREVLVIVVYPDLLTGASVSPWIRYHSHAIFGNLEDACQAILELKNLP